MSAKFQNEAPDPEKLIIKRIGAALLLVFIASLPILIFSGIIKLPFISLPFDTKESNNTGSTADPDITGGTHETGSMSTGNVSTETATEPDPAEQLKSVLAGFEVFSSEFAEKGYLLSDGRYNQDEYKLMLIDTSAIVLPKAFTFGDDVREIVFRSDKNKENVQTVASVRPSLKPRMGFIFRENADGAMSLLRPDGAVIYDQIPENVSFVGARDSSDNPVFQIDDKYCYYDFTSGSFVSSTYDPKLDYRGIEFDYPSYYGKPDSDVIRFHTSANKWGYKKLDGTPCLGTDNNYGQIGAYEFRDERGVIFMSNNSMEVVQRYGGIAISNVSLYRPEHDGIEKLGFYMYEFGLMRARIKKFNNKGEMIKDYETVIGISGAEFFLPADYEIISYSDGVFLMKKGDYYGYLSHTGKWICKPVYTYAQPFMEGLGVIGYKDGKKGMMDTSGNYAVPPVFDQITSCSGGVISLYDDLTGYYLIHKLLIPSSTADNSAVDNTVAENSDGESSAE
ncbi:MAG: WG repeat-containing protein [Oscillospiraceae bacterium]|nr:WG repeat-containing protein [Oscillospiraceae bacterium]